MKFVAEHTDTFGGEANYAWCDRKEFDAPENASTALLVRRAKKALGITARHRTTEYGDAIRLDYYRACVCTFIYWKEGD